MIVCFLFKLQRLHCLFSVNLVKFYSLPKQKNLSFGIKIKEKKYYNPNFNESDYYLENGLRKVYPYYRMFTSYCKEHWINKKLINVFSNEYYNITPEAFSKLLRKGSILINGKKISMDYVLKKNDFITSIGHAHESPVLAEPIEIIHNSADLFAINKPHSLPVHPVKCHRHNTVLFILAKEHGIKGLYSVHRLDRPTSGVLIFTKTRERCAEIRSQLEANLAKKTYVCRVQGIFPDGEVICNEPLEKVNGKVIITIVSKNGKSSCTKFRKLNNDGYSSVVLCEPLSGRTHQIRVHLQYLGYPILNDSLYNSEIFGPEKGKNGIINKNIVDLLDDLFIRFSATQFITDNPSDVLEPHSEQFVEQCHSKFPDAISKKYVKDCSRIIYDPHCYFCNILHKDPPRKSLKIFLHALKYEGLDFKLETKMPDWAESSWKED